MIVIVILAGWALGALINYLADVLPIQRKLTQPVCPNCQTPRNSLDYVLRPRPCPACGRKPGYRPWLVQLVALIGAVWIWQQPPTGLGAALGLLVLAYFTLVVVIDIEHRLILFSTSLVGAAIGLAAGWMRQGLTASLMGGLAGFLIMLVIYLLGGLFGRLLGWLRGRPINEVPFGFGDVMLGTVLGLIIGWPEILSSLLVAILAAGLFSLVFLLVMLARRRYRVGQALPYAPFLILGAVWTIFL